jgi:2-dehydropantoate 2-reductase
MVRIAVIGAGGVGGYFGGRLAAAGEEVTFLARGKHLEAIRRDGLSIESAFGNARIVPARATSDPGEIGPVDLVIVAVKNFDTEEAGRAAKVIIRPETEVVSFQNGVEAWDVLARVLGRARILGGVAYITASIARPGVIRHAGTVQRLAFGAFDGARSEAAEALLAACRRAGIEAAVSQDIARTIWEKFVFLTAFSAMTALARLPIGPIRDNADTRRLLDQAMREAAAVSRARGVPLSEDVASRQLALCDRLPADSVSSMLHDLASGNRLEVHWLSGAVARMGRELGIETPVQSFAAAVLGLSAAGTRPLPGG